MNLLRTLCLFCCIIFPVLLKAGTGDVHLDSLLKKADEGKDLKSYVAVCSYLSDIERHADILMQYAEHIHRWALAEQSELGMMEYYSFRAEAAFMDGKYEEGFYWKRKALGRAEKEEMESYMVQYASAMGYYYNVAARYDSARYYLKKGMRIAQSKEEMADSYRLLLTNYTSSFIYQGETDSALVYAHCVERCSALNGDSAMWVENLNQLGLLYRRKKQLDKAIQHFEQALHLAEQQRNFRLVSFIYGNIATAYSEWNRDETAVSFSEKALKYARKYGTPQMQGLFLVNLGVIQCHLPDKRQKGIASLHEAIILLKQVNNKRRLCEAYTYLTNAYIAEDQLDKADEMLHALDLLSSELQTDVEKYRYILAKATLLKAKRQYAEALEFYEQLTSMLDSGYMDTQDYERYLDMAQCWRALERKGKAFECLSKAYALRDSVYRKEHISQLSDFSVKYQMQEKELTITRLREKELKRKAQLMQVRLVAGLILLILLMCLLVLLFLRQVQQIRLAKMARIASEKEQQFLALQKVTERRLTQKYIEGLESERGRVAKELHDDVCNTLLGIAMRIESIVDREKYKELDKLQYLLENVRERLRRMSHELMPPAFQYATIDEMLQDYVLYLSHSETTVITYRSTKGVDWKMIPEPIVLEFYRVIQEALSNALKHAEATEIQIELTWEKEWLSVHIWDNGKGFDWSKVRCGLGLRTMKQRAEAIGASVGCESVPEVGTGVYLTVKVSDAYGNGKDSSDFGS